MSFFGVVVVAVVSWVCGWLTCYFWGKPAKELKKLQDKME